MMCRADPQFVAALAPVLITVTDMQLSADARVTSASIRELYDLATKLLALFERVLEIKHPTSDRLMYKHVVDAALFAATRPDHAKVLRNVGGSEAGQAMVQVRCKGHCALVVDRLMIERHVPLSVRPHASWWFALLQRRRPPRYEPCMILCQSCCLCAGLLPFALSCRADRWQGRHWSAAARRC